MGLAIKAISASLPSGVLTNQDLVDAKRVPYTAADIERKTGIVERKVAGPGETPVRLAQQAAQKLFEHYDKESIDWIVFCTHTPDYTLPSCSCILHGLLGMSQRVGAFDIALSCSGFVYSLIACQGILEMQKGGRILLVNSDNYTKYLHPLDPGMCTLFGDAATVTLLEYHTRTDCGILGFKLCTDGQGYQGLIRQGGGSARPIPEGATGEELPADPYIRMNGPEIFRFVQRTIPQHIEDTLTSCGLSKDSVDYFLLHQGSEYMLAALTQRMAVDSSKIPIRMRDVGNTVSATIPLLTHTLGTEGIELNNKTLVFCGFGAGLSYGTVVYRSLPDDILYL